MKQNRNFLIIGVTGGAGSGKTTVVEQIEKADKKRASYYNYYSYKTWGAAATYHLCVDSSVMGVDKTVEYILQFIKHKLNIQ